MQLSKLEEKAYQELKRNNMAVFKAADMMMLLKIDKIKAYNLIKALKGKGAIKKTGKSFFAFSDADEFIIGQSIHFPSYLSFWSALSYYGFSDQLPRTVFYATTKYSPEMDNYKYITISRNRFFGYIRIGDIVIAEKEKAIIDSLLMPKYAGGIKEVKRCIHAAIKQLDRKKLFSYALRMDSKALLRRLGYILEDEKMYDPMLKKLRKLMSKGIELLDPSLEKKGNINKKWLLRINC